MQFFLQLDCSQLPAEFECPTKTGVIQLFFCGNESSDCETWMPFSGTHEIRMLSNAGIEMHSPEEVEILPRVNIVGWEEIEDTPDPEDHESCGLVYDYDFENNHVSVKCGEPSIAFNKLDIDLEVAENVSVAYEGDKLGGWPNWVQGAEYPSCTECGSQMELLIQIDSEDNLAYMFGDVGRAHLTQCREHPNVLAFGWACS